MWLMALLCLGFNRPDDPDTAERDALLARANASVQAAAGRAKDDPARPVYHVLPPANWINDPNGPLFHKGYYHLFYQHNPYGDEWGHMHWGHARSKDLAHWEHLPIALWPSKSKGEDHVFSGSAAIRKDGTPLLFYTSIGDKRTPEQWAAIPADDDLITWKKHPANPILTEAIHGGTKVHEWRDPYVFEVNGKPYMVCGGNLNASQGGQGIVRVYRAEDETLTKWTDLGTLFQHPDAEVKNVECPIFFPLDGRWVLIVSQGQPVDWFVGDLDEKSMRFTPRTRGKIDYGQVYAPSVLLNDPKGRAILWGWVNGFPGGKGWRHCLTLPRQLSIGLDGRLKQLPAIELRALCDSDEPDRVLQRAGLRGSELLGREWSGAALRLDVTLGLGDARRVGLDLLATDEGTGGVPIRFDGRTLEVADTRVPVALEAGEPLRLAIFVDHSIVEVVPLRGESAYIAGTATAVDGSAWIARVVAFQPDRTRLALVAEGGPSDEIDISARTMRPAWSPAGDPR
jgi:beta-fructofuranosidase